MACPVLRGRSPAVDAREGTETAHFPAKIRYTTPRDAILCCSSSPEIPSGTAAADPANSGRRHRDPVRARDGWLNSAARCRYMHCRAEVR